MAGSLGVEPGLVLDHFKKAATGRIDRPIEPAGPTPKAVEKLLLNSLLLRKEIRGDILVHGSRTLVNALKAHGLVDEYRLMIFPIILCSGTRMFEETPDATTLELIGTESLKNGAAVLTYRVVRP